MESNQPTGLLEQESNGSGEETKTIHGETNIIEEGVETQELQTTTLKSLEQTNQQEAKTSEETKIEEFKETNIEEMTSDQLYEQILNIEYLFNNSEQINEAMEKQREDQTFEFIRQIKESSFIEILKGKEHEIYTERVLNADKIINKIQNFFENLKCCDKDCPHKAVLVYSDESIDQIYCRAHENATKHSTEAIIFENELDNCKSVLQELEKKILFLQVKMIIIRNLNKEKNLYSDILQDLEYKLGKIKNIVITMKKKVKSLTELFKTNTKTDEEEKSRFISLTFIKADCKKCSITIPKILFKKFDTSLDNQIEFLINLLYNARKCIELDKESNFKSKIEAPSDTDGEKSQIIDVSPQSRLLMEGLQTEIEKTFEYTDTNQKSAQELVSNINLVCRTLKEKIEQSKFLINERLRVERIERYTKKQMIKQISFRGFKFYSEIFKIDNTILKKIFAKTFIVIKRLGQFQYCHSDFTPGPIQQFIYETNDGNKAFYSGQLKEGTCIKEGIGIAVYSDGDIYEGCWKNGRWNGKGRNIFDDESYYIGEFKDGLRHGCGILYFVKGESYEYFYEPRYEYRYEGEWKNGKKHGQGAFYYENGDKYEGEWKDGYKNGQGVNYYKNGDRYEGEFKDGMKLGQGFYYFGEKMGFHGDRFEGENRDGFRNGQGTYYWKNGGKCTGEWKDGEMNGQGTQYNADGSWWTGEWKNNKWNGFGTEYAADGTVLRSGNWVNDEYVEPE